MDTHLNSVANPAITLFQAWNAMVRLHNPNLDAVMQQRAHDGVGELSLTGLYHQGLQTHVKNRINPVRVDRYAVLWPTTPFTRDGVFPGIQLCYGWPKPNAMLLTVDCYGRFRFGSFQRYMLRDLARHTFIGHQSNRGDLVYVQSLAPNEHFWRGNFNKHQPFLIQPSWRALRHGAKAPLVDPECWFELFQDERGHWRLKVSQNQNPGGDPNRWAAALMEGYERTDRMYELRRRRAYRNAGVPDPNAPVPAIITQNPDALAKAFPIFKPAPAVFPERKAPLEAVTHG